MGEYHVLNVDLRVN